MTKDYEDRLDGVRNPAAADAACGRTSSRPDRDTNSHAVAGRSDGESVSRGDLRAVVADTLCAMRPLLPPRLTIDARLKDAGPCPTQTIDVMQVVAGLATHAANALGHAEERFSVSLACDRQEEASRLCISFRGMIASDALENARRARVQSDLTNAVAAADRSDGRIAIEQSGCETAISVTWHFRTTAPREHPLHDCTVLLVAGEAGAVGRLTGALEGAGAEVSLCLDARDAVRSASEAIGMWDLAIVAGDVGALSASSVAEMLSDADRAMPVATCVPHASANGSPTIGHRDDPTLIVRTASELIQRASCAF